MRKLAKIGATLFILAGAITAYLYAQHPFVFQELSTYPAVPLMYWGIQAFEPDDEMATIDAFDAFVAEQFEGNKVRGGAVAIVANGDILWSKGYGFANVERGVRVSADTPFMIGSISKAVTGVTLMHAVEANQIDLDADINDYLSYNVANPNVPNHAPITLRHLATHTSGIVDNDWVYANSYQSGDPAVSLAQFLRDYLQPEGAHYSASKNFIDSQPGDVSEYSNIATGLAGQVFAEATGTALNDYAETHIFAPLGMHNTGWFLTDFDDVSQIAQPYGFANRPIPHYGYPTWPEGQLRTSANDLGRLLAMVMQDGQYGDKQLLASQTVETMLAKQTFTGLAEVAGDGIFWSYTNSGSVGHNGGDVGVSSAMYFDPETNIGVVVLTNASISRGFEPVINITRQLTTGDGIVDMLDTIP